MYKQCFTNSSNLNQKNSLPIYFLFLTDFFSQNFLISSKLQIVYEILLTILWKKTIVCGFVSFLQKVTPSQPFNLRKFV